MCISNFLLHSVILYVCFALFKQHFWDITRKFQTNSRTVRNKIDIMSYCLVTHNEFGFWFWHLVETVFSPSITLHHHQVKSFIHLWLPFFFQPLTSIKMYGTSLPSYTVQNGVKYPRLRLSSSIQLEVLQYQVLIHIHSGLPNVAQLSIMMFLSILIASVS